MISKYFFAVLFMNKLKYSLASTQTPFEKIISKNDSQVWINLLFICFGIVFVPLFLFVSYLKCYLDLKNNKIRKMITNKDNTKNDPVAKPRTKPTIIKLKQITPKK